MKYFAYGSNMLLPRIKGRAASARPIGACALTGHKLAFHKRGRKDKSGKCDAMQTDSETDFIYGVLFEIDPADKTTLDRHEGLSHGYEEKLVSVLDSEGHSVEAFTYFATDIDSSLLPFTWYLQHVVSGAKAAKLPTAYIAFLEQHRAVRDPDRRREKNELERYR